LCLEGGLYNMLIVDKNLPGLDGMQLARIVHLLSPNMPILVITGYGSEESARDAAALGVRDYVRKPIDIDCFRRTVHEHLRRTTPVPSRAQRRYRSTFPPGTLPAVVARLSAPPKVPLREDETPAAELLMGVSVLLVERRGQVREKLVEILGYTECRIAAFQTVAHARAHVERHGFDVLLGAPEVLLASRSLFDQCPRPPLGSLAIMERDELDEVIEAIRLDARGVIAPPFATTDVFRELARMMKGLADERTARAYAS
jgi:DNA-binding NtrC family response regulator